MRVLRIFVLVAGPLLGLAPLVIAAPTGLEQGAWRLIGVTAWMVVWWLPEVVPIWATALLPLLLMPLLGIAGLDAIATSYGHPLVFLFLGGFLIAGAMQQWGLHRRISLYILRGAGRSASTLVGGFMVASALLSMWISNTATAVMMFPVGLAVIHALPDMTPGESSAAVRRRFGIVLMLGIAYGCSIGGVATLIGTPPNMLLAAFVADTYGFELSFATWLAIGLPFTVLMLPTAWLWLTRVVFPLHGLRADGVRTKIDAEIARLGPVSRGEWCVAAAFLVAALMWMTRPLLIKLTGLALTDSSIAMAVGMSLFVLPASLQAKSLKFEWRIAKGVRWGVLVLFGGGLALAATFKSTGLANDIAQAFSGLSNVSIWIAVVGISAVVLLLTELTSNTATTATFLPIVAAIAVGWGQNPLILIIPVTIAASGAFMLPVATPPNAVVFGYDDLRISHMVRAGIGLNLLSIVLVVVIDMVLCRLILGVQPDVLPAWAN